LIDSGMPLIDSGMPLIDSGMPLIDSGMPLIDSGTPLIGAHFMVGGNPIFNPFQWVFHTSPQFIRGWVRMQNFRCFGYKTIA